MQSSNPPTDDRDTQVLRASVVEAAFDLGPKVAKLIFEEPIAEEDSAYEIDLRDQILTPGLTSSTSSEDSHSSLGVISPIGHPGQRFPRTGPGKGPRPNISLPLKLGTLPPATFAEAYYLESPFVVINKGMYPASETSSFPSLPPEPQTPSRKMPLKGFRFTPKKREKTITNGKQDAKDQTTPSAPVRPGTPSPSATGRTTPPRSITSNPSLSSTSSRTTPTRLRKPKMKDWDFKDADRPSFFMDGTYTARNGSESDLPKLERSSSLGRKSASRKPGYGEEDSGYISEGSGLRFRRKQKPQPEKPPLKRSLSSRFMRKFSGESTNDTPKSATPPPLPIASRFATQRDDKRIVSPTVSSQDEAKSRVNNNSPRDTMYSSSSSFALVPDLNAAKRLGLDKYPKRRDGAFGSDNELKLEMLKKLLAEKPIPRVEADDLSQVIQKQNSLRARRQKNNIVTGKPSALPELTNRLTPGIRPYIPPPQSARPDMTTHARPRSPGLQYPMSARPDLEQSAFYRTPRPSIPETHIYASKTMSVTASGLKRGQSTRNPVRGRDSPFPVRPIPRVPPVQAFAAHTPSAEKFQGIELAADVPRSVKSSYSKDLEIEETEGEARLDDEEESRSMYSRFSKYIDDETGSRASFMDQEKSELARELLVGGVLGEKPKMMF